MTLSIIHDSIPAETWRPAMFYRREGERLRCTLCPHDCLLSEGGTGYCQVRRNHGSILETATGRPAVVHWDAIEKKPLYHFRPGTLALTIGASGCSLGCSYCQNFRLSQFGRSEDAAWRESPCSAEELVAAAAVQGASIALSYSEPSLAAEFTLKLSELARPAGVPLVWKTNGFITSEALEALAPCLSAVNLDIKAASEKAHLKLTGGPLWPVMESLRSLAASPAWLEVSTPIIPEVNDDPVSLRKIADSVVEAGCDIPWHLIRFVPDFRMKGYAPTHPEMLDRAMSIGREAGLNYVYVEAALGERGLSTFCKRCGATVVIREKWGSASVRLREGRCCECLQPVPGSW
jgi:pyruvate formate lyase activating enzyme